MVTTSFKPLAELLEHPAAMVPKTHRCRVPRGLHRDPVGHYLLVTLVMAVSIALLQIALALPRVTRSQSSTSRAGASRSVWFSGAFWCPRRSPSSPFSLVREGGLVNTMAALVLPFAVSPGTFMVRQALVSVPDEIIEAARLDGASEATIIYRILGPSSRRRWSRSFW